MNKLITPIVDEIPHLQGNSIGVIGGSGAVVQSFISTMHYKNDKTPIKVYVKNGQSEVKLKSFLIDLGTQDVEVTQDLQSVRDCE